MSNLLMYGIKQQKRKVSLGFEPYVAPADFDRTAQPVDIFDVFARYYATNNNAKYIYRLLDTIVNPFFGNEKHQLMPAYYNWNPSGFSWHYGYTSEGIDYTFDVAPALITNNTATVLTVNSTAGYPSTGTLCAPYWLNTVRTFVYTSKDETHFYGTGNNFLYQTIASLVINFTGTTKRWVITNNSVNTFENQEVILLARGIDWAYTARCKSVFTYDTAGGSVDVKYIHCNSLNDITTLVGGYSATMRYSSFQGTLHIPQNIAEIPDYFYANNISLTGTLTIPSNITTIGIGAFYHNMYDTIVSNATNFNVTDYVLYDITGGTKVEANYAARGRSGELTFRNDTTKILDYCCYYCTTKTGTALQSLASTITYIGARAFDHCTGLTGGILIPHLVTTLYIQTFSYCTGITGTLIFEATSQCSTIQNYVFEYSKISGNLILPASLRTLSSLAFYYCSYLKGSLTFEEGIETFTTQSFAEGCVFTGTLTLPSTLTSITNPSAFTYTHNFDSIVITGSSVSYLAVDNILYDIKSSLKVAAASARNHSGTLTLESDTTGIGSNAFYNCIKRTGALTIPNTTTIISAFAFYNCTGLNGPLTIGSGVVNSISERTFYATNFSSIASSSTGLPVDDNVLYDEFTAGSIKAVISARSYVGTLTLRTGITQILYGCFYYNLRTGSLTIPDTLTVALPREAFRACTGFNGTLTINSPAITADINGYYSSFYECLSFTALVLCANYSSTFLAYYFCNNFSGASLDASSANITTGTKTWTIGTSNRARMSAGAIAAALARGITIV